jgi:hypothetical protein
MENETVKAAIEDLIKEREMHWPKGLDFSCWNVADLFLMQT